MKILNNLGKIRGELKMSLRKLERLSGIDYSTINKIENGLEIPNQITILRISRALKLKTHEVFHLNWEDMDDIDF